VTNDGSVGPSSLFLVNKCRIVSHPTVLFFTSLVPRYILVVVVARREISLLKSAQGWFEPPPLSVRAAYHLPPNDNFIYILKFVAFVKFGESASTTHRIMVDDRLLN